MISRSVAPSRSAPWVWLRMQVRHQRERHLPRVLPVQDSRGLLERIEKDAVAGTPLHRLGGEEDLKGIAVFFASEASRRVTGQFLAVDGGASL